MVPAVVSSQAEINFLVKARPRINPPRFSSGIGMSLINGAAHCDVGEPGRNDKSSST